MKTRNAPRRERRGNPFLKEHRHDPYRATEKLPERTLCPECGATYRNGRWAWPKTDVKWLRKQLCPACRRIDDGYPAGELILSGSFVAGHEREIMSQVRRIEQLEHRAHPLNRIIDVERRDGETLITTTDIHLPHCIGHALEDAWSGSLSTHYDREGYFTRVRWRRDD